MTLDEEMPQPIKRICFREWPADVDFYKCGHSFICCWSTNRIQRLYADFTGLRESN